MGSGDQTSPSPFHCYTRTLTLMLAGCSAPQNKQIPRTRCCAEVNNPGVPALLWCLCTTAGARRLMPCCYKWSHAACKKGAMTPGEAAPQCQIPPTDLGPVCAGDGCSLGNRALVRNGSVLFPPDVLQTREPSLSSHKCHLSCKEAKHYRWHFAKTMCFPATLKPLLSRHLLLAPNMQRIFLELLVVWS